MKKNCLVLTVTLCSWLGWWLGESFGIMTAYWLSFAGSLVGVFVGCFIIGDVWVEGMAVDALLPGLVVPTP